MLEKKIWENVGNPNGLKWSKDGSLVVSLASGVVVYNFNFHQKSLDSRYVKFNFIEESKECISNVSTEEILVWFRKSIGGNDGATQALTVRMTDIMSHSKWGLLIAVVLSTGAVLIFSMCEVNRKVNLNCTEGIFMEAVGLHLCCIPFAAEGRVVSWCTRYNFSQNAQELLVIGKSTGKISVQSVVKRNSIDSPYELNELLVLDALYPIDSLLLFENSDVTKVFASVSDGMLIVYTLKMTNSILICASTQEISVCSDIRAKISLSFLSFSASYVAVYGCGSIGWIACNGTEKEISLTKLYSDDFGGICVVGSSATPQVVIARLDGYCDYFSTHCQDSKISLTLKESTRVAGSIRLIGVSSSLYDDNIMILSVVPGVLGNSREVQMMNQLSSNHLSWSMNSLDTVSWVMDDDRCQIMMNQLFHGDFVSSSFVLSLTEGLTVCPAVKFADSDVQHNRNIEDVVNLESEYGNEEIMSTDQRKKLKKAVGAVALEEIIRKQAGPAFADRIFLCLLKSILPILHRRCARTTILSCTKAIRADISRVLCIVHILLQLGYNTLKDHWCVDLGRGQFDGSSVGNVLKIIIQTVRCLMKLLFCMDECERMKSSLHSCILLHFAEREDEILREYFDTINIPTENAFSVHLRNVLSSPLLRDILQRTVEVIKWQRKRLQLTSSQDILGIHCCLCRKNLHFESQHFCDPYDSFYCSDCQVSWDVCTSTLKPILTDTLAEKPAEEYGCLLQCFLCGSFKLNTDVKCIYCHTPMNPIII